MLQGSLIYSQYKIEDIHSITQQYYLTDYKGYHCRGKSLTAMTDQLVYLLQHFPDKKRGVSSSCVVDLYTVPINNDNMDIRTG